MKRHQKKVLLQIGGSWFRGFAAACLACYMGGINDWQVILNAGLAAILPTVYRYLNPKDPLGR